MIGAVDEAKAKLPATKEKDDAVKEHAP
jgi:hypothetical protein